MKQGNIRRIRARDFAVAVHRGDFYSDPYPSSRGRNSRCSDGWRSEVPSQELRSYDLFEIRMAVEITFSATSTGRRIVEMIVIENCPILSPGNKIETIPHRRF